MTMRINVSTSPFVIPASLLIIFLNRLKVRLLIYKIYPQICLDCLLSLATLSCELKIIAGIVPFFIKSRGFLAFFLFGLDIGCLKFKVKIVYFKKYFTHRVIFYF